MAWRISGGETEVRISKDELRYLIRENAQQICYALGAGSETPEDAEILLRAQHILQLSEQLKNGKDEDGFQI